MKITHDFTMYGLKIKVNFKDKPGKLLVLKFEEIGTEKFEKYK